MLRYELIGRHLLLHFYSVGRRRRRLQVGHLPGVLFQPSVTVVFARGFERDRQRERETNNHWRVAWYSTVFSDRRSVAQGGGGGSPPP